MNNWAKRFFRKEVYSPGEASHLAAAPGETAFVVRALGLKKGQRLLDLACGTGRHSLLFAKKGYEVVGLDITPTYLKEARRQAKKIKKARFIRQDMRKMTFQGEFDAAVNLFTSFGYFLNPRDDLKTLKGITRALKPGGRFLIDIIDADYLRRHTFLRNWRELADGSFQLEEVKMREGKDPAYINTWIRIRAGKRPASADFFLRLYDYARLSRLLRQAGLIPSRRWGGLDGTAYRKGESKRLVILARKGPKC